MDDLRSPAYNGVRTSTDNFQQLRSANTSPDVFTRSQSLLKHQSIRETPYACRPILRHSSFVIIRIPQHNWTTPPRRLTFASKTTPLSVHSIYTEGTTAAVARLPGSSSEFHAYITLSLSLSLSLSLTLFFPRIYTKQREFALAAGDSPSLSPSLTRCRVKQ